MNITVIISIYKDIESLNLILESLSTQTNQNFNIIISEDSNFKEVSDYILNYETNLKIKHISQEDKGWRKNKALNNAIKASDGEYLIFLDGDIIPYKKFIENHIESAEKNYFLSGRRVELGPYFSKLIRLKKLSYRTIEKYYPFFIPFFLIDTARHIEEGIYFKKNSFLENKINKNKKKNMMLVGCNFSCYKKDLEKINGFDEDYISPSVGEDVDLSWRFNYFGIYSKSVRYVANTFHLHHSRNWGNALDENNQIMKDKQIKKEYICRNGLTDQGNKDES